MAVILLREAVSETTKSVTLSPMRIGYARVSTDDQTTNLQLDALKAAGCDPIFEDVMTGSARKRPGLAKALARIRPGDKLVVWRLDRLGRDFRHLNDIADDLHKRGAHFLSLAEGIDTSSTVGEVIYRLFSVFSDFERNIIRERTVAGLAAAKARGTKLGRRRKLNPAQAIEAAQLMKGGDSADAVALKFGVARATVYRRRAEAEKGGVRIS
jgi:DNA invertase Pin-like site-specific DNA recombinase